MNELNINIYCEIMKFLNYQTIFKNRCVCKNWYDNTLNKNIGFFVRDKFNKFMDYSCNKLMFIIDKYDIHIKKLNLFKFTLNNNIFPYIYKCKNLEYLDVDYRPYPDTFIYSLSENNKNIKTLILSGTIILNDLYHLNKINLTNLDISGLEILENIKDYGFRSIDYNKQENYKFLPKSITNIKINRNFKIKQFINPKLKELNCCEKGELIVLTITMNIY